MKTSPGPGDDASLKAHVRDYWDAQSCDTQVAEAAKFSRAYFEQIESFRYLDQPFIHSFAQFSRYHGRRVLEVGFGAGTDLIQWLRAGALVSGIDLTPEALEHARHRIRAYGLPEPETLQVGDAENLAFESNRFDLGFSFGVLHHTPDTETALRELVRVIRPGGHLKVMLYNRRSIFVLNRWVRLALLKGRPGRSLSWILANTVESPGTRGYTRGELVRLLGRLPLRHVQIHTEVTAADYLSASALPPLNWLYRRMLQVAGYHYGWHPADYTARANDPQQPASTARVQRDPSRPLLTGNPWGFFHCIGAEKGA